MSKVDDNQLQKLGEVLSPEEIQGLLDGTHSVTPGRKGKPKTADEISVFMRYNRPCLVVHRGWAKALDQKTFEVIGQDGKPIRPTIVNHSYFDARLVPDGFRELTPQHVTRDGVTIRADTTIDISGSEVRNQATPEEMAAFADYWYSQRAR